MSNQPEKQNIPNSQIRINDNIIGGEYANFMQVDHNKEEFRLIFGNIFPPSGKTVAKILTTPGHFKRILAIMQKNLELYEKQFGKIEETKELEKNKEIGFKQ